MAALFVLLGVAVVLLVLGLVARMVPGRVITVAACLVGLVAAIVAAVAGPAGVLEWGAVVTADGLASAVLAALFLLGACGAAGPVTLGALALAMLAGDALGLAVMAGVALVVAPGSRARPLAFGLLIVALLLLAWHGAWPDPHFAGMRAMPPGPFAGPPMLLAALGAVLGVALGLPPVPGAVFALYLLARLLLDLPGPVTPGWWGAPVLAIGLGAAALMARRCAAADSLQGAVVSGIQAALALGGAGIGVALLARGADVPSLAAMAVAAALLLLLAAAGWGGLLLLGAGVIQAGMGTTALGRLGGLLPRAPLMGLALLVGLASLAAMPLSAGFAAMWLVLQAALGAARLGGTGLLMLVAGGLAVLGLTIALLAAAALRLGGVVLLGAPRSARAAALTEPAWPVRLAAAALGLATLLAGLVPALPLMIAQPAVRQLTSAAAEGEGLFLLAGTADGAGYAAPAVALLLALCVAASAWAGRGATANAPTWRGGLAEDGPSRANTLPLRLVPDWRAWAAERPQLTARHGLAALALALAAALGWAAH